MATSEVITTDSNPVVCGDCWESFASAVELELHQGTCSRVVTAKVEEDSLNPAQQVEKVDITGTQQALDSNCDESENELTVLKNMPPSTDNVNSENNELLSVFEQTVNVELVPQSNEHVDSSHLANFNLQMSQQLLGAYIQQQEKESSEAHENNQQSESKEQSPQNSQPSAITLISANHQVLQQVQSSPSHSHITTQQLNLIENGIGIPQITTKNDKSNKRKLLPKVSRPAEYSQVFECTQCDFVFYNDASYRDHARSHAKVKEFSCEYCGITLPKYEQMTKHLDKEHNSDLSYYCYLCQSAAEDKFALQEHLKYCGKEASNKNHNHNQAMTSSNVNSGGFKVTGEMKAVINCLTCGQILATEDMVCVNDKPMDVQCKYCGKVVTLLRQTTSVGNSNTSSPASLSGVPVQTDNSPTNALINTTNLQDQLLVSATLDTASSDSLNNVSAAPSAPSPLLLYSQNSNVVLSQTTSASSTSTSSTNTNTTTTTTVNGGVSQLTFPAVTVNNTNHMTLGINTPNGVMLLSVPVVTTDKVGNESAVTAPLYQLPNGNFIFLGTDMANQIALSPSSAPTNILPNTLPVSTTSLAASPASAATVNPTTDILLAATAGINSPPADNGSLSLNLSVNTESMTSDLKTKLPRYSCSHCGKSFELYQSWRRHEQNHVIPKKQHNCNICGKTFSRPGQLKDHTTKVHGSQTNGARKIQGSQDEANNNEVQVLTIKT